MPTIWCVEDEQSIRDILLYTLRSCSFEARGFENGKDFWQALEEEQPDLVLLDIMLPGDDGLQLLDKIRRHPHFGSLPVIMTTAKGMEYDKIHALEAGADDYLVKPFSMMEMTARIRAVLRRSAGSQSKDVLRSGAIELDAPSHRVSVGGTPVTLTRKEYSLLELLMNSPERVFTRDELFEKVWNTDFAGESRTVDVHVGALRSKLGNEGSRIETVHGVGYRLRKDS